MEAQSVTVQVEEAAPRPVPPAAGTALFDERSGEIQEIISYVPGLLVRWGIGTVCLTLLGLLAIAWFVRYPELVPGRVTVTTPTLPVRLVARTGGEIEQLFAADGAQAAAGEPLAILRSAADHRDALRLSRELAALESSLEREGAVPPLGFGDLRLGGMQGSYSLLLQHLSDYRTFVEEGYYPRKIGSLERQLASHRDLHRALERQHGARRGEVELAEKQLQRDRELAQQGLLSQVDRERGEIDFLQRKHALDAELTELASSEVSLVQYETSLLDLRRQQREERRRLELDLRGAARKLRSELRLWEEQYLLAAPASGQVSYLRPLDEGHFVQSGEPVLAIVPRADRVVARMLLTQDGAGRVEVGQRAMLRLDGYPADEYGFVHGRVTAISSLPEPAGHGAPASVYRVEIELPDGLATSFGETLAFRQEMEGTAEIVTEDLRLLERLLIRFRHVLSSRSRS